MLAALGGAASQRERGLTEPGWGGSVRCRRSGVRRDRHIIEVVFYAKVLAHVAEGFFSDGHLAEVVTPGVGACAAAHEGFAFDDADGAVGHGALEGLGGHLKGDGLAGFPERLGEIVIKKQSVVTSLGLYGGDRGTGALPGQAQRCGVPLAKIEAVLSGLADENFQQVETRHSSLSPHIEAQPL